MKKFLISCMAITLSAGLFSGCWKKKSAEDKAKQEVKEEMAEEKEEKAEAKEEKKEDMEEKKEEEKLGFLDFDENPSRGAHALNDILDRGAKDHQYI